MDAQASSPPASAAQEAVGQAALALLRPEMPPWVPSAFENVCVFAAALWIEQQHAPSRAELRTLLASLLDATDAICEQLDGTTMIGNAVLSELEGLATGRAQQLHDKLAGAGQANALDRLGYPAVKLIIATGVLGLCRWAGRTPPGGKHPRAIALCAALLRRTCEMTDAASISNAPEQWAPALRMARKGYAQLGLLGDAVDGYGTPEALARYVVERSIGRACRAARL